MTKMIYNLTVRDIPVEIKEGEAGGFYATSPKLAGLLVFRQTLDELRNDLPWAVDEILKMKQDIRFVRHPLSQSLPPDSVETVVAMFRDMLRLFGQAMTLYKVDSDRIKALEKRCNELEQKVAALEPKPVDAAAVQAAVDQHHEEEAFDEVTLRTAL